MQSSIQSKIDTIIQSKILRIEKIILLRELFEEQKITIFSDFDDTITSPESILYFRYKILERLIKNFNPLILLTQDFILNKSFKPLLSSLILDKSKIVILTGNDHVLASAATKYLEKYNIFVVWAVGQSRDLRFSKKQKIDFIGKSWVFIGDKFENPIVRKLPLFRLVKSWSKVSIYLIKAIAIGIFLILLPWQISQYRK